MRNGDNNCTGGLSDTCHFGKYCFWQFFFWQSWSRRVINLLWKKKCSVSQHVSIVKIFYENQSWITVTMRELHDILGRNKVPNKMPYKDLHLLPFNTHLTQELLPIGCYSSTRITLIFIKKTIMNYQAYFLIWMNMVMNWIVGLRKWKTFKLFIH